MRDDGRNRWLRQYILNMSSEGNESFGKIKRRVTYDELKSAWWAIEACFESYHEDVRNFLTSKAFTELLASVGWTPGEWNDQTNARRLAKGKKA